MYWTYIFEHDFLHVLLITAVISCTATYIDASIDDGFPLSSVVTAYVLRTSQLQIHYI